MSELYVVAVIKVREGTEHELRSVLAALVAPSQNDDGNLSYEMFVDQTEPRRFVMVQHWADEASYVHHDKESDHIRQFTKNHGSKIESAEVYRLDSIG